MKLISLAVLAFLCHYTHSFAQLAAVYKEIPNGVVITYRDLMPSLDQHLEVQFIQEDIVHVYATPLDTKIDKNEHLLLVEMPVTAIPSYSLSVQGDSLQLTTAKLKVRISLLDGVLSFYDQEGKRLIKEVKRQPDNFEQGIANGDVFYAVKQHFELYGEEGIYGLGQHQGGAMNYKGRQVKLLQYNTEVAVPFLVSTKNYGLLWNNYSITTAGDVRPLLSLSDLQLYGKDGQQGWLTASYLDKKDSGVPALQRPESDIAYYFLSDTSKYPVGIDLSKSKVLYEGRFASPFTGLHRFYVNYAGYLKIWINGQLMADRWRESWNAGSFELDVQLKAHESNDIRMEWIPDGNQSYLGVKWQRPLEGKQKQLFSFSSEAGDGIDYYFVGGQHMDEVISGYRKLTGKATLLPKWAFGYWQSRERYKTQEEIEKIAKEFRDRKIPIDNLVLDWSYWKEHDWGSQEFDEMRFPDAQGMINRLHQNKYHFMISVWPKFNEEASTYPFFLEKGWLYRRNIADGRKDWIGKGYTSTFYDPFNADARSGFWNLLDKQLYSKGVDAFWMDASEPDVHSNINIAERKSVYQPQIGSSTRYYNAFPLENARGIYEGQRTSKPDKRVFILTRSAFAGQQRYAAATWSGDIASRWHDMKDQIAAGVNFSMSGLPYWTMDVGGFLVEKRFSQENSPEIEEWREMNARWFQFGAFVPLYRAHGQYPYREPFHIAPEGHQAYESMLYYIQLRYRLMPYIYSLAGQSYRQDYTIMRGLAMDFAHDKMVWNINDQYMFGPALLVNPVTDKGKTDRSVYLPKGSVWYDFYTGGHMEGGQLIQGSAPYGRMPLFVRGGSIIPMGPTMQYVDEKTLTNVRLLVYEGADGYFELYEDQGTDYGYEQGQSSIVPFTYNHGTRQLIIGDRKGSYKGMPAKRQLEIVYVTKRNALGFDSTKSFKIVQYDGKKLIIDMGR